MCSTHRSTETEEAMAVSILASQRLSQRRGVALRLSRCLALLQGRCSLACGSLSGLVMGVGGYSSCCSGGQGQ